MELSKLNFVGTAEEFATVAHLFAQSRTDLVTPAERAVSTTSSADDTTSEIIRRVLRRRQIPDGQRALYKALYAAGDRNVSQTELAAAMGRTEQELSGVLGALGNRVNGTEGSEEQGVELLLYRNMMDGEMHYRLRPEVFEVLRRESLV
jgi:hypothetical protein